MDKDVGIVAGFLVTIFLVSFAFHLLYVKGYAYDWAIKNLEKQHQEGSHEEIPRAPQPDTHH